MRLLNPLMIMAVLALMVAPVSQTRATTIYAAALNPGSEGEYSNLSPGHQQVADDFQLAMTTTLTDLIWYGRYDANGISPNPVDFTIRIFADNSGSPATNELFSVDLSVNPSVLGSTYWYAYASTSINWLEYSTPLPNWMLSPGTYWVSILENDSSTPPFGNSQWLWADTSTNGVRAIRNSDGLAWVVNSDVNHAFTLGGTQVPEPASIFLLATGLGLVGVAARRRKQ